MDRRSISVAAILIGTGYLTFTFISFASQNFLMMFAWGILSCLLSASYLKEYSIHEITEEERLPLVFVALAFLSCLLVLPYSGYKNVTNLGYFIYIFLIFLVAHLLTRRPQYFYLCIRGTLLLVQTGLVAIVILSSASDPLGSLVEGSSANGITSYLIVLQACYNVAHFRYKSKLPSWIFNLLTLLICYIGSGRGSLVASIMLLTVNFFYGLLFEVRNKRWIYWCLLLCGIGVSIKEYDEILSLLMRTNLARGLYDQPRVEMWIDYYRSMNFFSFFWGNDLRGSIIGDFYMGNPHNSFIRAHSKFGLGYLMEKFQI